MICINFLIYANLEKLKRKFGKSFINYFVNKYHLCFLLIKLSIDFFCVCVQKMYTPTELDLFIFLVNRRYLFWFESTFALHLFSTFLLFLGLVKYQCRVAKQ